MASGYQRGKNPSSHGSRESSTYSPTSYKCKACGKMIAKSNLANHTESHAPEDFYHGMDL